MKAAGGRPQRVLAVWCHNLPAEHLRAENLPAEDPDAAAFEQVIEVVAGFSPRLEVVCPGLCALSADGPARYFGGEETLVAQIAEAVAGRGISCRVGIADGLFAARLAAQAGRCGAIVPAGQTPAFLAPHPVAALDNPELADLLPRLGIWTLGEFAALPAAEAASRFGVRGALAHRLASGGDPRPLVPRPPAADLCVTQEFDPPAGQAEPVIFAAKALAQRLHAGLAASGLVCVRVQVAVVRADGRESTRLWRHDGLLSDGAVAERVRWQLAGWQDPAPGVPPEDSHAGGITVLRLSPDQLARDEGRQLGLWGDAVISDQLARAAVRVQAMLGHSAVLRPVLSGGRSPAEQVTLVPFGDAAAPGRPAGRPWPGRIPVPGPATVYQDPAPAIVTDGRGEPVTVTGRALVSAPPVWLSAGGAPPLAVTAWAGPWPLTQRWWDPATARRLARFQLVTEDGSAWLAVVREGRWLIEASYD